MIKGTFGTQDLDVRGLAKFTPPSSIGKLADGLGASVITDNHLV